MTNEEMLLRALNGETLAVTEFQPQTNKQAYLAYAVGLITDPELLPEPRTNEEVLLREYCLTGGGVELPELSNPALAAHILADYEAINQDGEVIVGTLVMPEGDVEITDASYLFYNGARLDNVEGLLARCRGITSMSNMFGNCKTLTAVDVSGLDTSKVGNMSAAFQYCEKLTDLDVSNWDTGSATLMGSMFSGCRELATLDVSNFDTKNVTSFSGMFSSCNKLSVLDASNWNTDRATSMSSMFNGCAALRSLDVSGFNTASVKDMNEMFNSCSKLTALDLSSFNTGNVTTMSNMFRSCSNLIWLTLGVFDTKNVTSMSNMFSYCNRLREITNFSAANKAGMSIDFPKSYANDNYCLRRLTFRTDIENSIRSAINIKYCSFKRDGMVEMFNSLPDVSGLGLSSSYTTITITGNPCVSSTLKTQQTTVQYIDEYHGWEEMLEEADGKYFGYDIPNVQLRLNGSSDYRYVSIGELDKETFESYENYYFLERTFTVPEEDKLTDADRAIATSKGWTLVE